MDNKGDQMRVTDDDDDIDDAEYESDAQQELLPANFLSDDDEDDVDLRDLVDDEGDDETDSENEQEDTTAAPVALQYEHMGELLPVLDKRQRITAVLDEATGERIHVARAAAQASEHAKLSSDRNIRVRQAKRKKAVISL